MADKKSHNIILAAQGKTPFIVVTPQTMHEYEYYAAEELKEFFYRATGAQLRIASDSDIDLQGQNLLLLGRTALKDPMSVQDAKELGEGGYIVRTEGSRVYMCGGGYMGTLYAVYAFLNRQFGYEAYALEEIRINTTALPVKLMDFDLREKPDIPYRNAFGDKYYFNTRNAYKMRFNVFGDIFIKDSHQPWHNSFRFLPPEKYRDKHPKWYIEAGTQLHFTAHGDAAELKAMQDELFDKMTQCINQSFEAGKYLELLAFTQQDTNDWAADSEFERYKQKYGDGAAAAMMIHFLNPVAKRIDEFMKQFHGGRRMNIITFAYWPTESAPVELKNGKWTPMDDSVILEENLSILYAPIVANYHYSLEHAENQKYKDTLDKWIVLSKSISLWLYSTNFRCYLMFYDSFDSMQPNYQLAKRYNAYFLFNESNWNYGNLSFNALKEYFSCKLQWDTEQDSRRLIEDFIDNYYKDAAPLMLEFFDAARAYMAKVRTENNYPGYVFAEVCLREYWPLEVLKSFIARIEQMYRHIAPLKVTDIIRHNLIYDRICAESLMYRYLKLFLYPDEDNTFVRHEREAFRNDCSRLNITLFGILDDGKAISDVWLKWRDDKYGIQP